MTPSGEPITLWEVVEAQENCAEALNSASQRRISTSEGRHGGPLGPPAGAGRLEAGIKDWRWLFGVHLAARGSTESNEKGSAGQDGAAHAMDGGLRQLKESR